MTVYFVDTWKSHGGGGTFWKYGERTTNKLLTSKLEVTKISNLEITIFSNFEIINFKLEGVTVQF
jgi:hypothetical protein